MDVRHEQPHGAALGDFPGFVQIRLRALDAASPEPVEGVRNRSQARVRRPRGRWSCVAGAAEAGHGVLKFDFGLRIADCGVGQNRLVERGAAQREVVEGDVEKRSA